MAGLESDVIGGVLVGTDDFHLAVGDCRRPNYGRSAAEVNFVSGCGSGSQWIRRLSCFVVDACFVRLQSTGKALCLFQMFCALL